MTKQIAFLLAVMVAPSLGVAAERGLYVGASLGENHTLRSDFDHSLGAESEGRSFKVFAGLDIGRHLAVELAYHDLGSHSCCDVSVSDWGYDVDVESYSTYLVGKLPISRFDLFATLGYRFWDLSGSAITIAGPQPYSDAHPRDVVAGAGTDVRLTDHLALRVEWEYFPIGEGRWNVFADAGDGFFAGLRYEF